MTDSILHVSLQEYRELERMWRDTRVQLTFARAEVERLREELAQWKRACDEIQEGMGDMAERGDRAEKALAAMTDKR